MRRKSTVSGRSFCVPLRDSISSCSWNIAVKFGMHNPHTLGSKSVLAIFEIYSRTKDMYRESLKFINKIEAKFKKPNLRYLTKFQKTVVNFFSPPSHLRNSEETSSLETFGIEMLSFEHGVLFTHFCDFRYLKIFKQIRKLAQTCFLTMTFQENIRSLGYKT